MILLLLRPTHVLFLHLATLISCSSHLDHLGESAADLVRRHGATVKVGFDLDEAKTQKLDSLMYS